ncbi:MULTISPECIES: hypothetical protein [Halomonadaceae]|uniref:Uncharacterized protein n=1 Tax=Vreelandella salicampi TaxID=1449798 RepID=A0A7Z0LMX5_9GAMM|nr:MULTISPECIES: hypothetical protein [Halomonas]NYS61887.1 hypothetical protein [Halomonas salicampi]
MTPQSRKARPEAAMAGLKRSHQQRRNRSVTIVRRAISRLQEIGSPVTLGRIARISRELSDTGMGISESTILRNPECHQLYEEAAQPVRRRRAVGRSLAREVESPTDAERRRMHYLMRQTKAELAVRIIAVERELACSEKSNGVLRDRIIQEKLGLKSSFKEDLDITV